MKQRFRHGCPTCLLIAQTTDADVHLCLPPDGTAGLVVKTDNSRLSWQLPLVTGTQNGPGDKVEPARRAGLAALNRLGLRPAAGLS